MNVEIGAEAALFPENEYISRIFVAVPTNTFVLTFVTLKHKLIMELGLQKVYLGSMSRDVHSCSHWRRPRNSPLPPHLGSYTKGTTGKLR
jgi:hypothetical protein